MFKDYNVSPQWVTRVIASERLSRTDGQKFYVRCVSTAKYNLENLKFQEGLAKEDALDKLVHATQEALEAMEKAFREGPCSR